VYTGASDNTLSNEFLCDGGSCNMRWNDTNNAIQAFWMQGKQGGDATKDVEMQCHMTPLINNVDLCVYNIFHTFQLLQFDGSKKKWKN